MNIFFDERTIRIRSMRKEDAQIIYETYRSYGWHPSIETYENYFQEQENKKRVVFVAEYQGNMAGICTLVIKPTEGPFADCGIPEIVDLSVFSNAQNKGIGNKLLDIVEQEAKKISDRVYLAVGVHSGYGQAQRIYVKRGYLPDGSGVWYQGKQLEQYVPCVNDDDLVLFMSKKL